MNDTVKKVNLYDVMTLVEVCETWGVQRMTVLMAIYRDKVDGRKSGKTWLISTKSCIEHFGDKELVYYDDF